MLGQIGPEHIVQLIKRPGNLLTVCCCWLNEHVWVLREHFAILRAALLPGYLMHHGKPLLSLKVMTKTVCSSKKMELENRIALRGRRMQIEFLNELSVDEHECAFKPLRITNGPSKGQNKHD